MCILNAEPVSASVPHSQKSLVRALVEEDQDDPVFAGTTGVAQKVSGISSSGHSTGSVGRLKDPCVGIARLEKNFEVFFRGLNFFSR